MIVLGIITFLLVLFVNNVKTIIINNDSFPVLHIKDGSIRGTKNYTVQESRTYYAFRGIPFAKPPLDNLRFKDPVSNEKWDGILNATYDRNVCTQNSNPVQGTEDCLYINVYTPSLNTTGYTVMVWIYGGAFVRGSASYDLYAPDYLLEQDIIYVSFNYRLGIFGFMSTEDVACPGNIGLKDQVLALKWIQNNIEYFGGDPKRITIFGESAGASSVSYLLQTNMTKGLFSAAILQSGSSLCLWGLNRRSRRTAFSVGEHLGIRTSNSTDLVERLRKVDFKTLQNSSVIISTTITLENPLAGIMYGPVIEPHHNGALFSSNSDELLRQGGFQKVPILCGFNSNEGAAVGEIPAIIRPYLWGYDLDPTKLTPADLTNNTINKKLAGFEIKNNYFSLLPIGLQTDSIVKFVSDDQFNRPIRRMVMDTMNYTNVYLYTFSYEGHLGGVSNRSLKGVGHAEDLGYIFRTYYNSTNQTDVLIRDRIVRLWTNFAKYHNPTPKKDPLLQNVTWYTANILPKYLLYLNIDVKMELDLDPFNDTMPFWDHIYSKYGTPPFNTY